MSSVAGLRGTPSLAGYCATKGDVRLFAKAVAMECAAAEDGIRVDTVHPGVIEHPAWTKLPVSAGGNVPIEPNEVAKTGVPFGRAGQAQDAANGVLFLASDGSRLHDGRGIGDRRWHDGRRASSMELSDTVALSTAASAKCDFSGKFHSNISMGDSAKVACFGERHRSTSIKGSAVRPEAGHRVFSR
jgi:hypothetical protein